ncbi:hypothetical protein [Herbiconiux liukaitaii]|uniref:hypothetical protein n=1 Tax=Herbiconiux liukaitaii TaxID=3342799 RepID=UPI0035B998C2
MSDQAEARPDYVGRRRELKRVLLAYAALFLVMWVPPAFGYAGLLYLYPLFLLLWFGAEVLAIPPTFGSIRALIRHRESRRSRAEWLTAVGGFVGFIG